jgi:hypothetical protein
MCSLSGTAAEQRHPFITDLTKVGYCLIEGCSATCSRQLQLSSMYKFTGSASKRTDTPAFAGFLLAHLAKAHDSQGFAHDGDAHILAAFPLA